MALYHLVRAFPKVFGNALSFIPYVGIWIKFLPEFIDIAKEIENLVRDYQYEQTKKRIRVAIGALKSTNRGDRLDAIDDLEDVIDRSFVD